MKKVSLLAAAFLFSSVLFPAFSPAGTVLMNNFGYMYETGGFPVSNQGDVLEGVGNVTSIAPPLTCDLTANELTWSIRDLVSLGQFSPDGGRTIIVSYAGGVITLHCDPSKNRDFGINPPNVTAPSTFEDGEQFLIGSFTQFVMFYNSELQVGSFQGRVNFTTGTSLVDLENPNGVIFAGTVGPAIDPNIPEGYSLEAIGRIVAPSLCTVRGNVSYVYDAQACEVCNGITRLVLTYTGMEDISTAMTSDGTVVTVQGNQLVITPGSGSELPGNTTVSVGADEVTIHTSCSRPLDPGNVIGAFTVSEVDKVIVPCDQAECEGITELVLLYHGIGDLSTATISTGAYAYVVDDTLTILPTGTKLPTNTTITVDSLEATIHTSCSQPIEPGSIFGDYEVFSVEKIFPEVPDGSNIPPSGPIVGATVDLVDGEGNIFTTLSDENGDYIFYDVATETVTVSVLTPIGYVPLSATDSTITCTAGGTSVVDFLFEMIGTKDMPRSVGFWKHQVNSALIGKQKGVQVPADQLLLLFEQVHNRFDQYFDIFIPVVTLQDFSDVLSPVDASSMYNKARSQFAAMLLNVVSNRLATWQFVSEDNATVSQAITFISQLLTDGDASNDELAKDIAEAANKDEKVAAGVIPLSIQQIAYTPPPGDFGGGEEGKIPALLRAVGNYPNPFNPATTISYELTGDLPVSLTVYNVLGQRVRTLLAHEIQNGVNAVTWNGLDDRGRPVSSGVYIYRLQAGNQVVTNRMLLLK